MGDVGDVLELLGFAIVCDGKSLRPAPVGWILRRHFSIGSSRFRSDQPAPRGTLPSRRCWIRPLEVLREVADELGIIARNDTFALRFLSTGVMYAAADHFFETA